MLTLRPAAARGHADHGWLNSHHSFSFAAYYDPRHMGVSVLRVINDDRVAPGHGFDTHPHRDMEIISVVLDGAIEHRDTMGSHAVLRAGEVQVMSAGTGIFHSEYNPDPEKPLHFLQIWVRPAQAGLTPRYAQRDFSPARGLTLMVSPDGRDGSLRMAQDVNLYLLRLHAETLLQPLPAGRLHYVHVARGALELNGQRMTAGDGATLSAESLLSVRADEAVEALWFDLPPE